VLKETLVLKVTQELKGLKVLKDLVQVLKEIKGLKVY
jgi:hypothetical protein